MKIYWLIYFIIYFVAVWLSILVQNPFVYLFVGFLPYVVLRVYKAIHDPMYDLRESIEKIAPGLVQTISQQKSKLNIKMDVDNQKHQAVFLYAGLLLLNKDDMDQRILVYIRNNKRINWNSMVSLTIWFFTFLIFLLALFVNR